MGVLSSAFSADTENAPVDVHEGIGEERQERELRSSGQPPKSACAAHHGSGTRHPTRVVPAARDESTTARERKPTLRESRPNGVVMNWRLAHAR